MLRDAGHVGGQFGGAHPWELFRAISFARRRDGVCESHAGLFQDAAVSDKNSARAHVSGMPVLGDENVPGALFCGMLERGIRRGGTAVRKISGIQRRVVAGYVSE